MDKKICDFCGKDITEQRVFNIEIFNVKADRTNFEKDACASCQRRIIQALHSLLKKKGR